MSVGSSKEEKRKVWKRPYWRTASASVTSMAYQSPSPHALLTIIQREETTPVGDWMWISILKRENNEHILKLTDDELVKEMHRISDWDMSNNDDSSEKEFSLC